MNESNDPLVEQQPAPTPDGLTAGQLARRAVLSMIKIIVITYILWLVVLYFSQNSMLFPANMAPAVAKVQPYPWARTLTIEIDEGEVIAWLIRPPAAAADEKLPTVIFFHGNGEIIDYPQGIVEMYHRMGLAVLLPEYRGYGRVPGSPSQKTIVSDAIDFYDQLIQCEDIDMSRIYFHGRSIGGAVATQLASQRKPKGLILQSTFKSISSMAWRYGVPPLIVTNPFRSDKILQQADYPVLIFHGNRDHIVPVSHGRALHEIIPEGNSQYIEYDCGHNDFPGTNDNYNDYAAHIKSFLDLSSEKKP